MKKTMKKTMITILTSVVAGAAMADVTMLSPREGDQIVPLLTAADAKIVTPMINARREPVSFSWAVETDMTLTMPAGSDLQSREYWFDASAKAMADGVELPLTRGGALLRISPTSGIRAKGLKREALTLAVNGQPLAADEIVHFADSVAMKRSGAGFPEGTIALRLADSVSGTLFLQMAGSAKSSGDYVVHVFEPQSAVVLDARAESNRLVAGQPMIVQLSVEGIDLRLADAVGYVVSPDGSRSIDLGFESTKNGGLIASAMPKSLADSAPGLWEAHIFVEQRSATGWLMRDIKVPFALTTPTARFNGSAVRVKSNDIAVGLGVQVAHAGRYEVGGVLFGTLADGSMIPIAAAASARWMEPGSASMELAFDTALMADSDATAPFEVRYLTLKDQSRMGNLWLQDRGLVISDRFQ